MTRSEQLRIANEIAVLCGIASSYFNSFASPSPESATLQAELDDMATQFIELTEEQIDDGSPSELGICPACGEHVADPEGR